MNARLALRELVRRRRVDDPLDWLRFRLDTFPRRESLRRLSSTGYQPLPWVGLEGGKRAAGTESRWHAISSVLDEVHPISALDLGCNFGYFTLALGERGIPTVGIEIDPTAYRTALYARRKSGLDHVAILVLRLELPTVDLLPSADAVLFLSLWHHLVQAHGLEGATAVLERVWEHTRRVLFFDTGESEMPPSYGLPRMTPDARTWLTSYLTETCPGAELRHLGVHAAFAPDGSPCTRNLLAVLRSDRRAAAA